MSITAFTFTGQAQVAANGAHQFKTPRDLTIVGVDLVAEAFTGTPTAFTIDIQDDGTDAIAAIAASTAGTVGTWRSENFNGSNSPVTIAGGSTIDIDINFTGGSSPTADYTITIYTLMGTA